MLLPIWLVCEVLQIDRLTSELPLAWFPAYLAAAPADGHPTLLSLWSDAPSLPDGLLPGDELLEVGDGRSLRDASRLEVIQAGYLAATDRGDVRIVPFVVRRDGEIRPASLPLMLVQNPASHVILSLGVGLSAMLVLARGRGRRAPRGYALAATAYSLHFCFLYGGRPWQTALGLGLLIVTAGLYPPLLVRGLLLFPPSAAPRSRIGLAWPWGLALGGPAAYLWLFGSPTLAYGGFAPLAAIFTLTITASLIVLFRNYRRADARGRRQMRWALSGIVIGTLPPLILSLLTIWNPGFRPAYEISITAQLIVPLCFFIALVHDRLFDIDRLISATATLALLGVVPVLFLLTLGLALSGLVAEATGIQQSTVLGTLIVILIGPLPFINQRVSPWVHRKLFPERQRFESAMRALRRDLAACSGSQDLFGMLGDRLRHSVELESLAIYAPAQDVFAADYAHGPLVPPAFASKGRLMELLDLSEGPVSKLAWRRWARRGLIDASERASLEALAAEWVVPARRADDVDAVIFIGPKASGDLFTHSEATLFEGVAERAVLQLDRFDSEDRRRHDTRLIDELRRYVPASLEQLIEQGDRPEAGEREVSIFFGDVRGSTAWAEARPGGEVFEMVDRFTQRAARIVEQHRGTVVEFAGDGFMAVFGAIAHAETRERDAIAAGREILDAVADGLLPAEQLPERPIGVGIATGKAFVGDVHIGSHAIWTALGDTANLAARLESLTKELDASLVIDERTFRGAGSETDGFESLGRVEIRGRAQPEHLYALRSGAAGTAA